MADSRVKCSKCGNRYPITDIVCKKCGTANSNYNPNVAPKKRMGTGKKIGIGIGITLVAFFGLVIAASLAANNQQSDTLSQNPATTQQNVRVNDLTFSIVNATQTGRSITVIVDIENHGSGIEFVSWQTFRLIDADKNLYEDARPFPPDSGQLPAMGEIAPSATKPFKYVYAVPEGMQLDNCQLVVLEDSRDPKYLDLT